MLIFRKIWDNFCLDIYWLLYAPNDLEKFLYYFRKYFAIFANKKSIVYLWKEFQYDNRFTPALLQDYPREIDNLKKYIPENSCKNVLDIGANIGQFSITFSYLYPKAHLYSFEPNMPIFEILSKNIGKNITALNYGVSDENAEIPFYYTEGKSGQGSAIKANTSLWVLGGGEVIQGSIHARKLSLDFCWKNYIPSVYDLVKIDVEGLERQVLFGIQEISWRWLYMEVSLDREGSMSEQEILDIFAEQWKEVKIICSTKNQKKSATTYDIIIQNNNY